MILSTSLSGSFLAIFSVGNVAGKFPDLYSIAKQIK
jgi:hypothetical protein